MHVQVTRYTTEELVARQVVFLDEWVKPLYMLGAVFFPAAKSRLATIEANREMCKTLLKTPDFGGTCTVSSTGSTAASDDPAADSSVESTLTSGVKGWFSKLLSA